MVHKKNLDKERAEQERRKKEKELAELRKKREEKATLDQSLRKDIEAQERLDQLHLKEQIRCLSKQVLSALEQWKEWKANPSITTPVATNPDSQLASNEEKKGQKRNTQAKESNKQKQQKREENEKTEENKPQASISSLGKKLS